MLQGQLKEYHTSYVSRSTQQTWNYFGSLQWEHLIKIIQSIVRLQMLHSKARNVRLRRLTPYL